MNNNLPGRARTPEQKKEILDRLLEAWKKHPHLRLGQMICGAFDHKDFFYLEDDKFIKELEEWK